MKDRHLFSVLASLMLISVTVNAQDVITLRSGDEIQAKITEVTPTEIKYKRFDNLDGPTFTINKSDAFMLKYQNGAKDVFNEEPAPKAQTSKDDDDDEPFWNPELWTNKYPAGIGIFIDPAGLCFYGLRIGAELRYRRFDISLAGRFGSGPIMNVSHTNEQGVPDEVLGCYGFSVNPKFLFPNKKGFAGYVGEITDIGYYSFARYSPYKEVQETSIMTGLGGGFKFRTPGGFYTNISGYFGLLVAPTQDYKYGDDLYFKTDDSGMIDFFGMLEVAIGFEIPLIK